MFRVINVWSWRAGWSAPRVRQTAAPSHFRIRSTPDFRCLPNYYWSPPLPLLSPMVISPVSRSISRSTHPFCVAPTLVAPAVFKLSATVSISTYVEQLRRHSNAKKTFDFTYVCSSSSFERALTLIRWRYSIVDRDSLLHLFIARWFWM